MKKFFLLCILFCGVGTAVFAQQQKKTAVKSKSATSSKAKKKIVATRKTKAAKKAAWKKSTTKRTRKSKNVKRTSFAKLHSANRKPQEWNTGLPVKLTPEEAMYGNGLVSKRGHLPWPVDGTVSIPYGEYKIEGTRIKGMNPGITITTSDRDVPVKAVSDGIVSGVDNRGEVSSIFIKHGKYYTVYSNISSINVNKGDVVKAGAVIGNVGEAYETNGGELNFLVMEDRNNVDPSRWLSHQ